MYPPQGTQNFGSGDLPPQGTMSPHALAELMASPQSAPRRSPQSNASHVSRGSRMDGDSLGFGSGYPDMSPEVYSDKKEKKKKKAKDLPDELDMSRMRQQDLLQIPSPQEKGKQHKDRYDRPDPSDRYSDRYSDRPTGDIPTFVPTSMHPAASLQGSLAGGKVLLRVLRAWDLRNTDLGILPSDASDPFVVAKMGAKDFKTHVVENCLSPVWDSQQFDFVLADEADPNLRLEVFSSNQWHANDRLGRLDIPIRNLTPGEVHTVTETLEEEVRREDGKRARLQVEVQLLCQEQLANPSMRQGRGQTLALQLQQQHLALQDMRKKKENLVPLPSFKGFGPEAVARPDYQVKVAEVGEARRLNEYESGACRLGQYDYSGPAPYYPRQQVVDKRQWKDDPFSEWRRELNRAEHRDVPRGDEETSESWKSDPFHGWRQTGALANETNIEQLQEAKAARHLLSLPSFSEAPARRFNDGREYVSMGPGQLARREPRERQSSRASGASRAPEKDWKEDAFFGWLPGRGDAEESPTARQRPLQQARLARLPSFAEGSPELAGVTGRGIGVLTLWVNKATSLAYSAGSGLQGTPSPAVKVRVHRQEKVTATAARERDPQWNSPAMTFEVHSLTDVLEMEVMDLANPRGDEHLHHYFLGRTQVPIQRIIEVLHRSRNPNQPHPFREHLEGAQMQAQIHFECLYESLYNS
ncbi:unnamed protein product [Effrenium voratum]|nr:unnamed protein product [Effrenium voratum]